MGATRTAPETEADDRSPSGATPSSGPEQRSTVTRAVDNLRGHFRSPGNPRLWFELVLIAVSYWVYSIIRNAVPMQHLVAMRHAHAIHRFEESIGAAVEQTVNHAIDQVTWLIVGMNYYYATLHFVFTIAVLVWLFRYHPGRYAATRMVLFATTGLALIGFYFYPLAPPRLMSGGGFIDTVVVHHTWGSTASGDMANMSNQYAAMPSMHVGWSLWVGLTVAFLTRHLWLRILAMAYPAVTLVVIVATANHFWMDALGGALCLGAGFVVARLAYGRWAYTFPARPARVRSASTATADAPA